MNKQGIAFFYYFMLGICIIILGIAIATPTSQVIDDAMTQLVCNTPSSDFDEGNCIVLDVFKFFTVGLFLTIGGYMLWKVV